MKIGCGILAGGQSSRMGRDKALLEYKGTNFIEKIMGELSFFEEKIIARGENAKLEKLSFLRKSFIQGEEDSRLRDFTWKEISDVYSGHGPMGGIHAVLTNCKSDAMFIIACDTPFLKKSLVKRLCSLMTEEIDALIAVSETGRVHPLCGIYHKSATKYLEEQILADKNKMMLALDQMKVTYVTLTEEEESQLININTLEEYENLN